jgi:hypothetical protein
MTTTKRISEDQLIENNRIALANVENQSEIAAILDNLGFTAAIIVAVSPF